jgi:hypothetical protein
MEYFAGALIALGVVFFAKYFYEIEKRQNIKVKVRYRQSYIFHMTMPMAFMIPPKALDTQATRHFDETKLKIIFTEEKAYWIKDNAVYEADIVGGIIQENSSKAVDMMALDDVKLKDMMFIIDKLTEEQPNDRRDSWES